jgi:hypothetical protein
MSKGLHEAIVFTADHIDDRRVEKLWKDFVEEYNGDTDRNRKENEYVTIGANIIDIGGAVPVDIYFRAEEYGENTRVSVWFMTKDEFLVLSENPALQKGAEDFLSEFRLDIKKWRVKEQLEDAEDQLKDLERDLGKLIRLKERYEERIEDAKDEIKENKENIQENLVEQEAAKQNIEEQRQVVEKIKEMLNNLKIESE